jgi:prepilin-type N-terminal cleavage/methylation domain-containing protein
LTEGGIYYIINYMLPKHLKGFTLIELLVVIGILVVLLTITLIAINPAAQLMSARNTKRSADVNQILNAIDQYLVVHGSLPSGITTSAKTITSTEDLEISIFVLLWLMSLLLLCR